jgi:hypothetical protein
MHHLLSILISIFFLVSSVPVFAGGEGQQDVLFVVLGKTSNYRQAPDTTHTLLNYHFFAEIFLQDSGSVSDALLFPPDKNTPALIFKGDTSVLEVHGGRYRNEQELNEAYADGEYVFSYKLSDGSEIVQPVFIENRSGDSRIPGPITVYLSQDNRPVPPSNIDPEKNLTVRWSPFASGNADPNDIVDDLMFVVTGNCHGERIDHSGGPFGTDDYLTFASTEYVIPAAKLQPGETFQIFVEQAEMDSGMQEDIPEIATYAVTTFVDIRTTGTKKAERADCPALMPAFDGGQTDRPPKK